MDQPLARIEVFSWWMGFADPPTHTEKLTIRACGERFHREVAVEEHCDELDAARVQEFMTALGRPALPELTAAVFDQPFGAIRQHYDSFWTDDSPSVLVRVMDAAGAVIHVRSESQHAFMLPLQFIDSGTDSVQNTYDPRLSRSLAALMPEGFLNRERLADYGGMFQFDLDRANHREAPDTDPAGKIELVSTTPEEITPERQLEEFEAFMHSSFSREESPSEKADAERIGNHSQRLLKRIPLDELAALLQRGADPNVADDSGQTALMHAAFPPFNSERFERLVKAGANLEARQNDGLNGLQLACSGGEAVSVAAWLAAGADANAATPHGATPLMLVAKWDNIVRLLLSCHAKINATDQDGHSALAYAVLRQSPVGAKQILDSIRVLLSAGADVNLPDKRGLSPIDHARRALARVDLANEVHQAFAEIRTAEERRQWQAAREQHKKWLEHHRREHPEDEWLTNQDYDDRKLAMGIVDLLTAPANGSSGERPANRSSLIGGM